MPEMTPGRPEERPPRRTGHEEAWDLLPWYVNRSLEEAERERVEEHLATCAICREELRYWDSFAELVREDGELEVSAGAGLARLRRRLASTPAHAGAEASDEPASDASELPHRRWRQIQPPVRWLLAAQLAGLLLLGGLLAQAGTPAGPPGPAGDGDLADSAPTAFRTLSDPSPAAEVEVPRLRVVFADQTREREMRGILISVGGRLVAGPSPTGVYTVAIAAEDDVATVLETLRSFPQILLAEAAVGSGASP